LIPGVLEPGNPKAVSWWAMQDLHLFKTEYWPPQLHANSAARNQETRIESGPDEGGVNCHSGVLLFAEAAETLHFIHCNFARIHQSLRVTPAMEAVIADHPWTIEEIAGLLDKE
jgi:hypothetical protein